MTVTEFDPSGQIILVYGQVWGAGREVAALRLAVDTGTSQTILVPDALDRVGYSARQAERITSVESIVGREQGYLIRVARFECLGFGFDDFPVAVHDLPGDDLDGLLGLNFLRQFNYEVRSVEGRIRADAAQ